MQVWIGDELFGELDGVRVHPGQRQVEVARVDEPPTYVHWDGRTEITMPKQTYLALEVIERHYRHEFDDLHVKAYGIDPREQIRREMGRIHAPPDAVIDLHKDVMNMKTIFDISWPVLVVRPEHAETVFEMDNFQPA